MLNYYVTYLCCQWAQLRCRPSPYGDAVCVNAAVSTCSVTTSSYCAVRSVNWVNGLLRAEETCLMVMDVKRSLKVEANVVVS